ncbi:MAG: ABC transporter permease subunit [Pseudohongiellaceae bacterium]
MNHFEQQKHPPERGLGSKPKTSLKVQRKVRHLYDRLARSSIAIGGVGVIATMLLIFLFLLAEVLPLFQTATISTKSTVQLLSENSPPPLHMRFNEQGSSLLVIDGEGKAVFSDLNSDESVIATTIDLAGNGPIVEFAAQPNNSGFFVYSDSSGQVFLAKYRWEVLFPDGDNLPISVPHIDYPYGSVPLTELGAGVGHSLAVSSDGDDLLVTVSSSAGQLSLFSVVPSNNVLTDFIEIAQPDPLELSQRQLTMPSMETMFIGGDRRLLYGISNQGLATVFDLQLLLENGRSRVLAQAQLVPPEVKLESLALMSGGLSLLVGDSLGAVSQWFVVRSDNQVELRLIQNFAVADAPIRDIAVESRRKNFVAISDSSTLSLFNITSKKGALEGEIFEEELVRTSIAPRGNSVAVSSPGGSFSIFALNNPHPEISFSALWRQIWYESYPEPDYVWQSSAASSDFEPKYSLLPLTFGTLKAAFFAMLVAAPLAICGAIYTGYFMAPILRRKVKPLIELMEALPTVVLGFLAGLWLAPFVEVYLLGVLSLIVLLPVAAVASSFIWAQLPKTIRYRVPEGWEAVLLLPVLMVSIWLCLALSAPLEGWMFGGDVRRWLSEEWGVSYAQRNAMIVGIVMGFAVIPTIYSIAEDAIFTVPRHLSSGSLALGATSWQSLHHVVLPTASPGIFSAVMIGLGRAVGETMIILMATGNTPIMDFNMFEGMRTLSATIAIEAPESEVGSTHYRILFLAATVLFLFTFVVNTLAEVVRQQLRQKYSNI